MESAGKIRRALVRRIFVKQKFGVHASIAGGLHNALIEAQQLGCECVQIFVKNQRQWQGPPLTAEQIALWQAKRQEVPCSPIFAHGSYLVNLAATDRTIRRRSIKAFVDELQRCDALGVDALITHPGSHGGDGEPKGIARVITSLKEILKLTEGNPATILLEVTAGQGNCLGYRFEHLAEMIAGIEPAAGRKRLAICLDTCHLHAAGYDLATENGYNQMMEDLQRCLSIDLVRCIHTNDSIKPAGSHVDRHTHIGEGTIGLEGFRRLLKDKRLTAIPRILETPGETSPDDPSRDAMNLKIMRDLAG